MQSGDRQYGYLPLLLEKIQGFSPEKKNKFHNFNINGSPFTMPAHSSGGRKAATRVANSSDLGESAIYLGR